MLLGTNDDHPQTESAAARKQQATTNTEVGASEIKEDKTITDLPAKIDHESLFKRLWDLSGELRQKLETRFELHPDPSTANLKAYSSPISKARGSFNAFFGPEIERLVHSWLRNPESNFSNMHLTIWLGQQIRVPHLAFAFATIPEMFFYIDYLPRTDPLFDLEYLDRYYEPANLTYLALQDDSRLSPFISKSPFIRQVLSSISPCYTASNTEESFELLRKVAHEMLDRWLVWVNEAQPVPPEERVALAKRDLLLRRTVAERDPGNRLAVQMFVAELTNTLVRALWT